MGKASLPEARTMAMAPSPGGVEMAQMVFGMTAVFMLQKYKKTGVVEKTGGVYFLLPNNFGTEGGT